MLVAWWRNPFAWLPILALIGVAVAMRPSGPRIEMLIDTELAPAYAHVARELGEQSLRDLYY